MFIELSKKKISRFNFIFVSIICDLDPSGNPVTQSVVGVTDSSGNPVTGKNHDIHLLLNIEEKTFESSMKRQTKHFSKIYSLFRYEWKSCDTICC